MTLTDVIASHFALTAGEDHDDLVFYRDDAVTFQQALYLAGYVIVKRDEA